MEQYFSNAIKVRAVMPNFKKVARQAERRASFEYSSMPELCQASPTNPKMNAAAANLEQQLMENQLDGQMMIMPENTMMAGEIDPTTGFANSFTNSRTQSIVSGGRVGSIGFGRTDS